MVYSHHEPYSYYTAIRCDKIKLVNLAIEVSSYFQKNTNLNPIKSND